MSQKDQEEQKIREFSVGKEIIDGLLKSGKWPVLEMEEGAIHKHMPHLATPAAGATIATGFKSLDKLMQGGFRPGELTIIAGLPGVGKSALSIDMAGYAAMGSHTPIALFSLDMNKQDVALKLISSFASVSQDDIYRGFMLPGDREKLQTSAALLYNAPFYVDDNAHETLSDIKAMCHNQASELDLRLVVVDCIQLISKSRDALLDTKELAGICAELKELATTLNIPVAALYQLPHTWLTKKVVPHPTFLVKDEMIASLGADRVILIYRESMCKTCNSPIELCSCPEDHKAHLIVADSEGASTTLEFLFSNQFVRFQEV